MLFKSLIDKLKRLAGGTEKPATTKPQSTSKRAPKREPEKREIVSPEEQMALDRKDIAFNLETVEKGKELLGHSDPKEVERGRHMIGYNHHLTPRAYDIGQIKWRLGLGDPSEDLESAVLRQDASGRKTIRVVSNTYWSHLVAFLCVILSGSVPNWVARTVSDDPSAYTGRKRRAPYEINLGYQFALAVALHTGSIPAYWPRFLTDSAERGGLKRIHRTIVAYEKLFNAARQRDWDGLANAVAEVDSNYRKRGSSESSYARRIRRRPVQQPLD